MSNPTILETVFEPADEGLRLDSALAARFDELSRNRIQDLMEEGLIALNGLPVSSSAKKYRIKAGDKVDITLFESVTLDAKPESMSLDIIYEDDDVIVLNKPKGLVVHPAPGSETGTLVNGLLFHMAEKGTSLSSINGVIRPGIVHRIDKNTSGLLVVAKTDKAHASLSEQLAKHDMDRIYLAVVKGGFSENEGKIDAAIGRDPKNRKKQKVTRRPDEGRRAVTHYKVLERYSQFTLIELKLETGRTHQIRVHMASIGHPVLGDDVYGPEKDKAVKRYFGKIMPEGQVLHATTLGFVHPTTGERLVFESPLPAEFQEVLDKLRKQI